jgi:transcriptional regulator with XRE-family HTH domain
MEITSRRPPGRPIGTRKRDPNTLTPLAKACYDARVAAAVGRDDLAAAIGVSGGAIAKLESGCGLFIVSEDTLRAAAAFLRCDPAPLLAARDRSRFSYTLPNLSVEHAETAIALRDAWATLDGVALARVRAALAGGA